MTDLRYESALGTIEIEGLSLHLPSWWVVGGMAALMAGISVWRGDNVTIPGRPGTLELPKLGDEMTYSLQMVFQGVFDPDGEPYDDPFIGFETNLGLFKSTVCLPKDGSVTTRAAMFTTPSGSELTADVQPVLMVGGDTGTDIANAVLDITISAGEFEATGS